MASDVLDCRGVVIEVLLPLRIVLMLGVIEVATNPLAPEESHRRCFEKGANDLPEFPVGALLKVLVWIGKDRARS